MGKIVIQERKMVLKKVKKDISDLILWLNRPKKEIKEAETALA